MLAQLLKLNGAVRLVLAAPAGPKLELAKKLEAADEYIALDRENSAAQLEELKKQNPYGFDAVVGFSFFSEVSDHELMGTYHSR